jgi:hypothetical protein
MPIIPGLRRLRQEDNEFEVHLEYTLRTYLKKQNKTQTGLAEWLR